MLFRVRCGSTVPDNLLRPKSSKHRTMWHPNASQYLPGVHQRCKMRWRVVYRSMELVRGRLLQRVEITYCCLHQERWIRWGERLRFESQTRDVWRLQARGDERLQAEVALVGMDGGNLIRFSITAHFNWECRTISEIKIVNLSFYSAIKTVARAYKGE